MTKEPECPRTVEEEFGNPQERKRYTNTWGMTDEQLVKREVDVRELKRLYPKLPESWIEMVWSFVETKGEDEMQNIIKNKLWDGPPRERDRPGTYYTMTVEDPA